MGVLLDLTIIFTIAALVLYISARAKIPTIVGLLIAGFIAGPHGFGYVKASEEVELLAEIGILLLLFTIGMEFSLEKLLKTRKWIFAAGGLQVLLTTALIFLVARMFGLTWQQSILRHGMWNTMRRARCHYADVGAWPSRGRCISHAARR